MEQVWWLEARMANEAPLTGRQGGRCAPSSWSLDRDRLARSWLPRAQPAPVTIVLLGHGLVERGGHRSGMTRFDEVLSIGPQAGIHGDREARAPMTHTRTTLIRADIGSSEPAGPRPHYRVGPRGRDGCGLDEGRLPGWATPYALRGQAVGGRGKSRLVRSARVLVLVREAGAGVE
jgi:hypothetical protein